MSRLISYHDHRGCQLAFSLPNNSNMTLFRNVYRLFERFSTACSWNFYDNILKILKMETGATGYQRLVYTAAVINGHVVGLHYAA